MAPSYAKRHASERVCSRGAAKSFTVVDYGGVLSGSACSGLCDGPCAPRPLARNPKIDRQIDVGLTFALGLMRLLRKGRVRPVLPRPRAPSAGTSALSITALTAQTPSARTASTTGTPLPVIVRERPCGRRLALSDDDLA